MTVPWQLEGKCERRGRLRLDESLAYEARCQCESEAHLQERYIRDSTALSCGEQLLTYNSLFSLSCPLDHTAKPDRNNMGNFQQTYDTTDQEYIMCSRLQSPLVTDWHSREVQLLASDSDSYISTYQAARNLVFDCDL